MNRISFGVFLFLNFRLAMTVFCDPRRYIFTIITIHASSVLDEADNSIFCCDIMEINFVSPFLLSLSKTFSATAGIAKIVFSIRNCLT